jgi:hypothetical protein
MLILLAILLPPKARNLMAAGKLMIVMRMEGMKPRKGG